MSYKIDKIDLMLLSEDPIEISDYFVLHPKSKMKKKLGTEIAKINIVDHTLVHTIIKRKLKQQLEKVIAITLMVLEDEDEDPTVMEMALDEAAKFQAMLRYKYEHFLEEEFTKEQHDKLKKVVTELKRRRNRTTAPKEASKAR